MKLNITSTYITTRDGIRIAADLLVPVHPSIKQFSTILISGRYWRSFRLRFFPDPPNQSPIQPRDPISDAFLAKNYAVVLTDVRGTGASEGNWEAPWTPDEVKDFYDVIEFIRKQEWSNELVGATGISYEGSTAMFCAAVGHPSLVAVSPRSFEFDPFGDIILPGGVLNSTFMQLWSTNCKKLDENVPPPMFGFTGRLMVSGVRPVDKTILSEIIKTRNNPNVFDSVKSMQYRDDHYGSSSFTFDDLSISSYIDQFNQFKVPMQLWSSWMDGTTARASLELFKSLQQVPMEIWIGASNHEGKHHGSLGEYAKHANPPLKEQWNIMIDFFDKYMKKDTVDEPKPEFKREIHYYIMGREAWAVTPCWPPEEIEMQSIALSSSGEIGTTQETIEQSKTTKLLDMNATTGKGNRWWTQMALPVKYNNRAKQEKHFSFVWKSKPLEENVLMVGTCQLQASFSVSSPDICIIVYLEMIEANKVKYITEGMLKAKYAKGNGKTFRKCDQEALPAPDETIAFTIDLLPTSVEIPKGSQLRIGITGADKDSFETTPGNITMHWDKHPHFLFPMHRGFSFPSNNKDAIGFGQT